MKVTVRDISSIELERENTDNFRIRVVTNSEHEVLLSISEKILEGLILQAEALVTSQEKGHGQDEQRASSDNASIPDQQMKYPLLPKPSNFDPQIVRIPTVAEIMKSTNREKLARESDD